MRYFIDTEFVEGFHKPLFGKRRHFIDLISIGIVAEDGREMHCISNEYNYKDADDWVKENVILPLYVQTVIGDARNIFTVENFHKHYGFSNKIISYFIEEFVMTPEFYKNNFGKHSTVQPPHHKPELNPEFYAYYADYDWVVFCSLFGRMIDLPKGFPMYCRDLKQTLDEKAIERIPNSIAHETRFPTGATVTFETSLNTIKVHPFYPKQSNEHNALTDARWNMELFNFLENLK